MNIDPDNNYNVNIDCARYDSGNFKRVFGTIDKFLVFHQNIKVL